MISLANTTSGKIRVGIIGASTSPFQWGAAAHVPALQSLPEYELVAVASTRQETADAAAAKHSIPLAFGNYRDMVRRPDLDMICVVTSVMHHHELVSEALAADKHVFCEWPLGINTKQAVELRDAARSRGVHTLVGLQNQCAPIIQYVRDLVADGYVGKVMSADLLRSTDQIARLGLTSDWTYFLDKNAANATLMILGGHSLDTLAACVGEFHELQAYTQVMVEEIMVSDTGKPHHVTAPDHIYLQGKAQDGALISVRVRMHSPVSFEFRLEINGTRGALVIVSGVQDPFSRQAGVPDHLELHGAPRVGVPFERLEVPSRYTIVPGDTPQDQPFNVAQLYRGFSQRLATGASGGLDFSHGVIRHRLLDAIQEAAESGQRKSFISDR